MVLSHANKLCIVTENNIKIIRFLLICFRNYGLQPTPFKLILLTFTVEARETLHKVLLHRPASTLIWHSREMAIEAAPAGNMLGSRIFNVSIA